MRLLFNILVIFLFSSLLGNLKIIEKTNFFLIYRTPPQLYYKIYIYKAINGKIRRKVLKTRKEILPKNISWQIIGITDKGPVIIKSYTCDSLINTPFTISLFHTINLMRKSLGLKKLTENKHLKTVAKKMIKGTELRHYRIKSIVSDFSTPHLRILGEDIIHANSEKEAWNMLKNSLSHLYNILLPDANAITIVKHKKNLLRIIIIVAKSIK